MQVKILCIGDIVGRPGRQILSEHLSQIITEHQVDCVIANAENAAGGSGLTPAIFEKLQKYGINLITLGDHIYRKREIIAVLDNSDRIVRPANLSPQAVGKEFTVWTTNSGVPVALISLLGRLYMPKPCENPYLVVDRLVNRLPSDVKVIVVDMHAEATSEKIAMGWYLNGRVSLVFGTHTHVVTADETILCKGTGYITDIGMTGPHESVLGRQTENVLKHLVNQMPYPFGIASNDLRINALLATVDSHSGKALSIERLCVKSPASCPQPYDQNDGKPSSNHDSID